MEIHAKLNDKGEYALSIVEAPPKSVIELRWQDTISGVTTVDTFEVKSDGTAILGKVVGFGQHCAPTARVLNDKNQTELVSFAYELGETSDLVLVQTSKSVEPHHQTTEQPPVIINKPEELKGLTTNV